MPRGRPTTAKKKFSPTEIEPSLIEEIEEPTDSQPPTAKKAVKVTRTEQWIEKPSQVEGVSEVNVEDDFISDQQAEFYESVINDFGGQYGDWSFKVWKLPDYQKQGKTALKSSNREFCADLDITPNYMEIIKDGWGGGFYHIELRQNNIIRGNKYIKIALPNIPTLINSSNGKSIVQNGQATVTLDPMEQVRSSLDLIKEMRKAFGLGDMNPVQAQQQSAPLTTETAFIHLAMQNHDAVDMISKKFKTLLKGPSEAGETTTLDLILAAINVLPQMVDKAKGLLIEVINAKNGAVHNGQMPMATAVAPVGQGQIQQQSNGLASPTQGQTSSIPQTTGDSSISAPASIQSQEQIMSFALNEIMTACAGNAEITQVTNWLFDYEQKHPIVITPLIERFMTMAPDEVTTFLNNLPNGSTYTGLAHCKEWITNLQKMIRDLTDGEGKGDEQESKP